MPDKYQGWLTPWRWYTAALFPIGLGWFMYGLEASDAQRWRLHDPVPAVGEFASAECAFFRKRSQYYMSITYTFVATGYVPYVEPGAAPQPAPKFTVPGGGDEYPSKAHCEAALTAVRATRQPQPVWFERSNPNFARMSIEVPDSERFLWIGLGAFPLALVGWLLGRRRRPE